ncbi:MAG TPA: primosomal protein N' [Elusimicrobiota bacterium]|nr:primosomal protein N' [Elusimicrobiota bacterium]
MKIAEIAYPLPLHRTFDYEVPAELSGRVSAGMRVRAPFGPRPSLAGVVLSVRDGESALTLKSVASVLDATPILSEEHLALGRWLSARYAAPIGECIKSLLPASLRNARRALKEDPALWGRPQGVAEPHKEPTFELTAGQAGAVDVLRARLAERKFSSHLIFGVPASGKTEVYVRLIREAVKGTGQALFLVPEIALTRPFFESFASSVGLPRAAVGLWHSQMSVSGRKQVWLGLRGGSIRVVVGARSACLLPFKDLRLAVLDEEQDESYKQDDQAPCYHARDVVLERARRWNAVAVLGSATPSIESFAAVETKELELLRMDERVARSTPPPRVSILDRSLGTSWGGGMAADSGAKAKASAFGSCLSAELVFAIKDRLAKREQSILLVNRRGYSNFIICRKCGWVARCPECQVAFIHHQEAESFIVRCHHCGARAGVPPACGQCKQGPLAFAGVGTQKVVAELKSILPGVRVLRMDSDTVSKEKPADEGIYEKFQRREADVLVGTKLVAKGYHFPEVTLVGVVDADTMLHMPDFRAAERTVQLLVQAAGRAGRAEKPGEVLLQTTQPTHYAMQAVARLDYAAFARQEIAMRAELAYPPSSALVRILFLARTEDAASKSAGEAAGALAATLSESESILGPAPGVHAKFQGRFRYHLLVKARKKERLGAILDAVLKLELPSGVKAKVNVDPYDFM